MFLEQDENDILEHIGMPRRSGRYPWGSGKNPYQRTGDFLSRVQQLRSEKVEFVDENGKKYTGDTAIAKILGMTTTDLRTKESVENMYRRQELVRTARGLREKGYSLSEIAKEMGYKNDSSVRSLLDVNAEARMNQAANTAEFLKNQVNEKGMIMLGPGIEKELGNLSKERIKQALYILELEGYPTYGGGVPQPTNPGQQTNIQVLCPPGTPHSDIYDYSKINTITDYVSRDGGETFDPKWVYPKSMDSNRIKIKYGEEGGSEMDGIVEIRRNVDDLSLGKSNYAQVRILVDNDKYMKGMAIYSDNIPDGYDVVYNVNKKKGTPAEDVFKPIKKDPDNPFGALIKEGVYDPDNPIGDPTGGQSYYYDKNGKKQLSLINKRADEGDWSEWKDGLPSQFLAKQSKELMQNQLKLSLDDKKAELNEIMSIPNPTLKKILLRKYADGCDAAAANLQAASLPRQKYQVIMPVPSMKDTEVYAPNYENGEQVALIRYPHGGIFEIPILTVNNKHKEAKNMLKNTSSDVLGINSKVAQQLSGADFDGDTVMVIPTGGRVKITSMPPLVQLKDFDPHLQYGGKEEGTFKPMRATQLEMGKISNLITDMTLKGASFDEISKAVKHSMVVIDADKHGLDYKQSELDNDIKLLKKKYQGGIDPFTGKYSTGASTLISRAKAEITVPKRRGSPKINTIGKPWYDPNRPEGSLIWTEVKETYPVRKKVVDPDTGEYLKTSKGAYVWEDTGKVKERTQKSKKMYEVDDARFLVSEARTPQEMIYADYANNMKSLANNARKEIVTTGRLQYSKTAKETYLKEYDSLMAKLNVSQKNVPRERYATVIASGRVKAKKQANENLTKKEISKISQMEMTRARNLVGAKRTPIELTDREWEAIQAGAISEKKLSDILNYVDLKELRQRAMPRSITELSAAKISKIKAMEGSGYTNYEIAQALGVSTTTVSKYLS